MKEGDRQAPEGFYPITPGLMNPNSNYYLAINTGFPNAYDKANNRHGAFLMIHGDCSSRGCYAMTDEQIGEIYSLGREAFLGGQKEFQIQAYPFRMTPANLARHRNNPNFAFWKMIKEGYDHFEVSHQEPRIDVCDRHYVFDAVPPDNSSKPLAFNPTGACPRYDIDPAIAGPALDKAAQRRKHVRGVGEGKCAGRAAEHRDRRRHESGLCSQARQSDLFVRQRRAHPRAAATAGQVAAGSLSAARL